MGPLCYLVDSFLFHSFLFSSMYKVVTSLVVVVVFLHHRSIMMFLKQSSAFTKFLAISQVLHTLSSHPFTSQSTCAACAFMPTHPSRVIANITNLLLSICCEGFQKYKNCVCHQGLYNWVRGERHVETSKHYKMWNLDITAAPQCSFSMSCVV